MKQPMKFDHECIRNLEDIENRFLQVLVHEFELRRTPLGIILHVEFDGKAPAIWNLRGKKRIQENVQRLPKKARRYQEEIAQFVADKNQHVYRFKDPEFPFRFASGGALPVFRMDNRNYYALVYRECFPIGWNLANGGCDSRQEMLNPFITVERELREELIITKFDKELRYVLDMASDNPEDMPEHVLARAYWTKRLHLKPSLDEYAPVPNPIKWIDGPDGLEVLMGKEQGRLNGCFLNINARDAGIEVDRIAKLRLDGNVILDGEILNDDVVGAPIGLFEVNRMHREIKKGTRCFRPDKFYFDGQPQDAAKLFSTIENLYLPHMCRLTHSEERRHYWEKSPEKFDLCPVTRGILTRAASYLQEGPAEPSENDIFVSFPNESAALAAEVYRFLAEKTGRKIFFSPRDERPSFADRIDNALDSASFLVAVSSRPEYLRKPWVEYEYRSFNVLIRNGRKPEGAGFISYIDNFTPHELPLPLLTQEAITHNSKYPKRSLEQILKYIPKKKRR